MTKNNLKKTKISDSAFENIKIESLKWMFYTPLNIRRVCGLNNYTLALVSAAQMRAKAHFVWLRLWFSSALNIDLLCSFIWNGVGVYVFTFKFTTILYFLSKLILTFCLQFSQFYTEIHLIFSSGTQSFFNRLAERIHIGRLWSSLCKVLNSFIRKYTVEKSFNFFFFCSIFIFFCLMIKI